MRVSSYAILNGDHRRGVPRFDAICEGRLCLEAEIGDKIPALVLDRERAVQALRRGLGVLVAERRGALVIGFRGVLVPGPSTALLRARAHPLQRARMILRRRLLEQHTRA